MSRHNDKRSSFYYKRYADRDRSPVSSRVCCVQHRHAGEVHLADLQDRREQAFDGAVFCDLLESR